MCLPLGGVMMYHGAMSYQGEAGLAVLFIDRFSAELSAPWVLSSPLPPSPFSGLKPPAPPIY